MLQAAFLSFFTGFLSLGIEILWIRLFSFANNSRPQSFAFVLSVYLLGIALGAQFGRKFCQSNLNLWIVSGLILFFSSLVDLFAPWIYVYIAQSSWQLLYASGLIALTALLKAIVFPIAHHLGAENASQSIGRRIACVYSANILGATLGPLFIGIFLLSVFTTQQCFIICASLTLLLSAYCLNDKKLRVALSVSTPCALLLFALLFKIDSNLLIAKTALPFGPLNQIIENQYGIISIYAGGRDGDIITGGNVYDGRTNLDPVINSNGIHRVLVMDALCDHPRNILMIGLSIGTWLKLVTSFPEVENIDVVEINPGYLQAMTRYPRQYSALFDLRVHVYIDDGRRWLKAHPAKKYDMIIMNTTYYWRAYSANLLSREFLRLVKQHMQPNAVITYNTTSSPDVLKTAASIFAYSFLYENFVIAADFDWRKKLYAPDAAKKLAALYLDGAPLFPPGNERMINSFVTHHVNSLAETQAFFASLNRKLEVITDRNVITEYKYGKSLTETY